MPIETSSDVFPPGLFTRCPSPLGFGGLDDDIRLEVVVYHGEGCRKGHEKDRSYSIGTVLSLFDTAVQAFIWTQLVPHQEYSRKDRGENPTADVPQDY